MKNSKKRIGLIVVLAVILVAIILGYTFSKYTQSFEISTETAVAKWQFSGEILNSEKSSTTSTISLADTVDSNSIVADKIAPGTSGTFDIVIDATGSEVDLDYSVSLVSETNKPQNLFFTYDGVKYSSLSDLISSVNSSDESNFSGEILKNDANKKIRYTVSWEWPYETLDSNGSLVEGADEADLSDGQKITDYIFTIKITGTQKV